MKLILLNIIIFFKLFICSELDKGIDGIARYNSYPLSTTKCAFSDNQFKYYAAIGPSNFFDTYTCGLCAIVKNKLTQQAIQVTIVDQCLGCSSTDIIMDRDSFGRIADLSLGFINVNWSFTACPTVGNMEFYWVYLNNIKTISLYITNIAIPIKEVAIDLNGSSIPFKRLNFNLFGNLPLGQGGNVNLKLISIFDEVVFEPSVPVSTSIKYIARSQFNIINDRPNYPSGTVFPLIGIPNNSKISNNSTSTIKLSPEVTVIG